MATYYWVAPSIKIWNATDAWSLSDGGAVVANYPKAGDTAIFKSSSSNKHCTISANVSIATLDMRGDFTGELRTDNLSTYVHTITGDCIFGCTAAGAIKLGTTSTWNIGGNLRCDLVLGSWIPGTSKVIMTGTSKGLKPGQSGATYFYDLEINGTITSNTTYVRWHNSLTIKANKTFIVPTYLVNWNIGIARQSKLYLEAGATLNITNSSAAWYTPGTGGVASMASTANITGGTVFNIYPSTSLGVGVWAMSTTNGYNSDFQVRAPNTADGQFTFPNQNCYISGTCTFRIVAAQSVGTLNIIAGGSSCNVVIGGHLQVTMDNGTTGDIDVTQAAGNYWRIGASFITSTVVGTGDFNWNSGNEIIYFTGSTAGRYFDVRNIADATSGFNIIRVQKTDSGGILQYGDLYCNSLDIIDGDFDLNEYDAYIDNSFRVQSGATWTQSTASVITLESTINVTAIHAYDEVDPVVLNKTANGVTLSGHFYARTLTLTNGIWNANSYNITLSGGGIIKGPDALTMGSGIWSLGGNTNIMAASHTSTKLIFTGNATFDYTANSQLYSLTVNASRTVTVGASAGYYIYINGGVFDIYGTYSFSGTASGHHAIICQNNTKIYLRSGGTLTSTNGEGIYSYQSTSGNGILLNAGTWNANQTRIYECASGSRLAAGTYNSGLFMIYSSTANSCYVKPDSGTFNINCTNFDLYVSSTGHIYMDMTNNPTWNILGHCIYEVNASPTTVHWTASSETLEFIGTANQNYEWGHEVGNIVINNSGSANNFCLVLSNADAHLDCKSLTMIDGGLYTNGYNVTVDDDVILDCDLIKTTGSGGTWTIGGNFDWKDVVVWEPNSSTTFVITGTNKYLLGTSTHNLQNLTINTGASYYVHANTVSSVDVAYYTNIYGTLTINYTFRCNSGTGNMKLWNAATVTGSGNLRFLGMGVAKGLEFETGSYTFSIANTVFYNPQSTSLIPPGNYTGVEVKIWANSATSTWEPENGDYNFKSLRLSTTSPYTLNVENRTNQPVFYIDGQLNLSPAIGGTLNIYNNHASLPIDWHFTGGHVNSLHHDVNWYKGSGTLEFGGSGSYNLDMWTHSIEDVVFNGSGTWSLKEVNGSNLTTESFTLSSGTFDASLYDVTIPGDFDLQSGTLYGGSGTWMISGNADFDSGGFLNYDTSTFIFDGSGVTVTGGSTDSYFYKVDFDSTFDGILAGSMLVRGSTGNNDIKIDGIVNVTGSLSSYYNTDIIMGSSANFSGNGYLQLKWFNGELVIPGGATFAPDYITSDDGKTGMIIPARDYAADDIDLIAIVGEAGDVFELQTGTTKFKEVEIYNGGTSNGSITLPGGANFHITGNLYVHEDSTGIINWSSTGHTYMDGTGDHSANTNDIYIGQYIISKNSSIILDSDLNVENLTIETGNFDANDYNVTTNDFFQMDVNTRCWAGTGTWDIGGNWDTVALGANNYFLAETSEIKLTGSGTLECYCEGGVSGFHKLTISGTYTIPSTSRDVIINEPGVGWLKITNGGTLTQVNTSDHVYVYNNNDLIIESGGEIVTNSGTRLYVRSPSSGRGIPTNDGLISGAGQILLYNWTTANPIDAGTYCSIYCYTTGTVRFSAGSYTINGYLTVDASTAGNMILDLGTNSPTVSVATDVRIAGVGAGTSTLTRAGATTNFSIGDDFSVYGGGGSKVYTKGAAGSSITFDGTGTQDLNFSAGDLEDLIIDKVSGTALLASNVTTESFTLTNGTFDAVTYDVTIDSPGNITLSSGTVHMGTGSTWTCDGNAYLNSVETLNRDTGKLVMTGTSKVITGKWSGLYALEISTGATIELTTANMTINSGSLVVNGTLTCTTGIWPYETCQTSIGSSGIIDGSDIIFWSMHTGGGLVSYLGSIETDEMTIRNGNIGAAIFPAGTYDTNITLTQIDSGNGAVVFSSGDHIFTGNFTCTCNQAVGRNFTLYCNTHDPNIFINGNFYSSSANGNTTNWVKGTGLITFDNGDCTVDTSGVTGPLDAISISIASTLTLESDLNAQSLLVATGNFDANDFDVTLVDFFRTNVSTKTWAGTGTWDVGGDWDTVAATVALSFMAEGGEIKLTGSGNIEAFCNGHINYFHKLTISGTYTMPETSRAIYINEGTAGWLKIENGGTFTLADTGDDVYVVGSHDLIVETGGKITINSLCALYVHTPASGYGIPTNDGQITGAGQLNLYHFATTNLIDSGIYCSMYCYSSTTTGVARFSAGTYTINGWLYLAATGTANMTIDMGTNNPTVSISSDVVIIASSSGTATLTRAGATTDLSIGDDFILSGAGPQVYTKGAAGSSITFDGTGQQNLNFSAGDIEDLIIDKNASKAVLDSDVDMETLTGIDGNFDANDYNIISGDVDWNADNLDMGTGTWSANGNFNVDDADVTVSAASATLEMTGTSKTLGWRVGQKLGTLDIDTGASVTWLVSVGGAFAYVGDVNLDGTLNITSGDVLNCQGTLDINATGVLGNDGNGTLILSGSTALHGLQTFDGSMNIGNLDIHPSNILATALLSIATTYTTTGRIRFYNTSGSIDATIVLSAGTYIFDTPNVWFNTTNTKKVIIDNTANADIIFNGGTFVSNSSTGTVEWLKGTGDMIFAGATGPYTLDLNIGTVEDMEIDAAGSYKMTGPVTTESFLGTAGEIDFNGQALETIGDFTINSANSTGFSVVLDADAMNAADITVGNDFYVSNVTLNATNTWTLDVQGGSALAFDVSVRYSNANAGTLIDAIAPSNTDLGVNYNWDFGPLPIHSLSIHCYPWTRMTNRHVRGFRRR